MAEADATKGIEPAKAKAGSRDPKVLVLLRELCEVHLLLDNVSANPSTTVSDVSAVRRPKELDGDWIEKVCEISWPPDGSNDEKAEDAALLIRAKDYLNRLSYPASGSTIAFTLLVTQDDGKKKRRNSDAANLTGSPTRSSLAETAYPDLIAKAAGFRRAMWWISVLLVAALVATCALSWYVAYGNAALAELSTAREALTKAQTRVDGAAIAETGGAPGVAPRPLVDGVPKPSTPAPAPAATPAAPQAPAPPTARARYTDYCAAGAYSDPTQAQLCGARDSAARRVVLVEQRLASWTCWRLVNDCAGEGPHVAEATDVPSHAASLANILGSAVLPFFYGLLGAGAAIIRSLSRKIRASLLSPRDLQLSFQQLALGAVVGACIGLFIAAPGNGANGESLLGPVTLSGSAISFVAGFGVEAVFQALEALIKRIFNITSTTPTGNRGDGVTGN